MWKRMVHLHSSGHIACRTACRNTATQLQHRPIETPSKGRHTGGFALSARAFSVCWNLLYACFFLQLDCSLPTAKSPFP